LAIVIKSVKQHHLPTYQLSNNGEGVFERPQGLAGEAVKGNLERDPIILRVDASKLGFRKKT